jgi:hypothetical protein
MFYALFFNLLDILLNFLEKIYHCTSFGDRSKLQPNIGTAFGHLLFTEDYFYSRGPVNKNNPPRGTSFLTLLPKLDSLTVLGLHKKAPRNVDYLNIRHENDYS